MFRGLFKYKHLISVVVATTVAVFVAGCASIGTPGGGLYDETPPAMRSSSPADGATNVSNPKIVLHFNENVKLDNVMSKMTVSPPQEKSPAVLSNAKTVSIELLDSLKPNTTYTIDLGDAVRDNNEGNVLDQFSLTFSTGDHIDSLMIGGTLLNAADLEPVTGAFVGIYPDSVSAGDSAFFNFPMLRAAKTDAYGAFRIAGVAPGTYRLYALVDGNSNYRYDLFTENIAFLDSLVVPTVSNRLVHDTIWADSVTIDTIKTHGHIDYAPSDLLLYLFNEGKANLYLDSSTRPDSTRLQFLFSGPMPALPIVRLLDDTLALSADRAVIETSVHYDTVSFWLTDSVLYQKDTLLTEVTYFYTDTLKQEVLRTDTIAFAKPISKAVSTGGAFSNLKNKILPGRKKGGRSKEKAADDAAADSLPAITYMTIKSLTGASLDIGRKPVFEVSAPLASYDTAGVHLEYKPDTVWLPMPMLWLQDSLAIRRYTLVAQPHFVPGGSYRLRVDSAAMHDITGAPIAATSLEFRERTREEYSHLLFNIKGIHEPAFVQLLDEKDKPVQQAPVVNGQAKFIHVVPGKYYVRLVIDSNNNGRFDAGNLAAHRQPEMVYYFSSQLQLRANWQLSQEWAPKATDQRVQKPEEVKINKPKVKEEKESRNAEYYRKMGKTPPATTTTSASRNSQTFKTTR